MEVVGWRSAGLIRVFLSSIPWASYCLNMMILSFVDTDAGWYLD